MLFYKLGYSKGLRRQKKGYKKKESHAKLVTNEMVVFALVVKHQSINKAEDQE